MTTDVSPHRDHSRRPDAKRCAMSRKAARRHKSNMLFLAFAFHSATDAFGGEG